MAEPKKKRAQKPPDIEEDEKRREAEKLAKETQEEIVKRAVEKRFPERELPKGEE